MADLTKITTPFGLLDVKTQEALREYVFAGGEVEVFNNGWRETFYADLLDPGSPVTYRAKPKPLNIWVNEYDWGFGELYLTKAQAEKEADADRIRCIRLIEAPDQSEGV
jgi:hypothetical protein